VYAATVLSLLHRLTGSCAGLTAGSLMFAGAVLQPTSPSTGCYSATTRCDRRPGREIVKVTRDLWRLWWRRQLI